MLLVEDESNIRKMTRARLEREGYTVLTASQGDMGLAMAKREQPDLILLDVLMPKTDGREVLRRLKADAATQQIPVIMLTVVGMDEALSDPMPPGAVFHVTKPYDPQDLLAKVRMALGEDTLS